MDAPLLRILEERLDADAPRDAAWPMLVLAATEGSAQLERALGGDTPPRARSRAARGGRRAATGTAAEPLGAYLRSITVEGFRGVGARRTLNVEPGPGLTLVVGRNGSGKSSFAEGLEILLTGENWRWARRSKVWKEGWRNLHHTAKTEVAADLAVEGEQAIATVTRTWPEGADLTQSDAVVRLPSKGKADLSALGWASAMESYRPFLSYNELSAMFDGPTELHDRLSAILGLGALDEAAKTLATARLERERAVKAVKATLAPLLARLAGSADPRAVAAARALGARTADLEGAAATLGVATAHDREAGDALTLLRQLAALPTPRVDDVLAVVGELRDLVDRRAALEGTAAGEARELAELLEAALAHHDRHGDGICPVCGRGPVNQEWRARTEAKVRELRHQAFEADAVAEEARDAARKVPLLLAPPPASLSRARDVGVDAGPLEAAWRAFAAAPTRDLAELATHLEAHIEPMAHAAVGLRDAARTELDRREDAWRPLADALARWLAEARPAFAGADATRDLKAAEDWLKTTAGAIRRERFAPIETRAIEHWAALRQQSSVDLTRVTLSGTGAQRRVDLAVTIDGVPGAALGVMSQGELNAIALSLFLPRATLPESPFRFVVIDDPVQSMDPSRVDGLALVLADVAKTRQVIVFTHDDRLREAVARLAIDAHVMEVVRREDSGIDLRESSDPVKRHIDDAMALAKTQDLPQHVAAQVVPGFCRSAVEAACSAVIRRRWIGRGESHVKVEEALGKLSGTDRLALAIFDDAARGKDVHPRLAQWGEDFADAWGIANRGAHAGYRGSLVDLVRNTERLCVKLRAIA